MNLKATNFWLLKSEPSSFSIDDLAAAPQQTTLWDGVRNFAARNFIYRMSAGDLAFFYHSSCSKTGIVAIVDIVSDPMPDPTQFDPQSRYFDPKASPEQPRWLAVEVKLRQRLPQLLRRDLLRLLPEFQASPLFQRGNRLSVLSITEAQWHAVLDHAL